MQAAAKASEDKLQQQYFIDGAEWMLEQMSVEMKIHVIHDKLNRMEFMLKDILGAL